MHKSLNAAKAIILAGTVSALIGAGAVVYADPATNVSETKHPHLDKAQEQAKLAFDDLTLAQEVNHYDMGGHAKKAKELLEAACDELKLAAEAANKNSK